MSEDSIEPTEEALEFSRPVDVELLNGKMRIERLEATPEERDAVAKRLGLDALEELRAEIRLTPLAHGDFVKAEGQFTARVRQTCSVTLTPVVSMLEDTLARTYGFVAPEEHKPGQEIELDPAGEEPPDPIHEGMVDLGELVVEELSLAIDPFPRADGAVFDPVAAGVAEEKENPFAVLAKLRKDTD